MWKTTDGGASWTGGFVHPLSYLGNAVVYGPLHYLVCTNLEGAFVWETTDGGRAGRKRLLGSWGGFLDLDRLADGTLILPSSEGDLYRSTDDGQTCDERDLLRVRSSPREHGRHRHRARRLRSRRPRPDLPPPIGSTLPMADRPGSPSSMGRADPRPHRRSPTGMPSTPWPPVTTGGCGVRPTAIELARPSTCRIRRPTAAPFGSPFRRPGSHSLPSRRNGSRRSTGRPISARRGSPAAPAFLLQAASWPFRSSTQPRGSWGGRERISGTLQDDRWWRDLES